MAQVAKLKTLFAEDRQAINPLDYLNETFALYSIPAYDTGKPEIVFGKEVGSSKILLKDQDVLLSRIVPHIRRCWIVNGTEAHRRIGSGEWIVFRVSKNVDPKYLRYFFLTEKFGKKFMQTVRGVGGSLLRADPKQVGEFEIPLPPLPIQKKIAAILDKADSIRQKDKQLLEYYNKLEQSIFYDMFGDPVRNEKGWVVDIIQNVVNSDRPITYGILKPGENIKPLGVPYVRVVDIKGGEVLIDQVNYTTHEIANQYKRSTLRQNDILYSIRGHVGRSCIVGKELEGANITQDTARLDFSGKLNSYFALSYLNSREFHRIVRPLVRGAAVKGLNLGDLRKLPIPIPPLEKQNKFGQAIMLLNDQRTKCVFSIKESEALFKSLLQKAFKGELVKEA